MIPLIPALVFAFLSLLASAFVVLRIIAPILPPSPLSRRVSPSEFGLPAFRSLTQADKCHLWLAGFELLTLTAFVWHIISEATSGPSGVDIASDPLSAARLWLYITTRQGCLLVIASLILLHVRYGRSLSLGKTHWKIWAPVVILTATSTALAGVMSGRGFETLFLGLVAYGSASALLATAVFSGLFFTLHAIKRNLATLNGEGRERWPKGLERGRTSFATEDIDAIRDGASWFTSNPASTRTSVSSWSFSTHQTAVGSVRSYGRPQNSRFSSATTKSLGFSYGNKDKLMPQVSPVPSLYATSTLGSDPDPFRRSLPPLLHHPRGRFASQCSWLTSTDGSHTTLPAWSFPPSHENSSMRSSGSPSLAAAKVFGGNVLDQHNASHGSLDSLAAPQGNGLEVSIRHIIGWTIYMWLPMALSLPYLVVLAMHRTPPTALYVLYVLSVTISSPLLALNLVFKSPLPVPTGLFDRAGRANELQGVRKHLSTAPLELLPSRIKRRETWRSMSSSPTVVEGRRSGDVWLKNGDAVDRKGKLSRAMSMLAPKPPMSVIPPEELKGENRPPSPPYVPGDSLKTILVTTHSPGHSETSAEFGRLRSSSKSRGPRSSFSEESQATRIMVAQRHYSTLAQTIAVSPGNISEKQEHEVVNASGAVVHEPSGHLRTRSTTTSFSGPESPNIGGISLPPPFPLPPTPPSVRAARQLQLSHRKSFSSGYSFGPIDSVNEIDELSAGVLPLLVPGLKVGDDDVRITSRGPSPSASWAKAKGKTPAIKKAREYGENSSSPELHSTLMNDKSSAFMEKGFYQKSHPSLANLGSGKDGIQTYPCIRGSTGIAPPSAASSESLFKEFEAELLQNPHSHSTPQLVRPPVPLAPKASKTSSIVYIRSKNVASSTTAAMPAVKMAHPAPQPNRESFIQRSARAGQSLIPKASLRKLRIKSKNSENRDLVSGNRQGLRQLTLLRDQDTNSVKSTSSGESGQSNEGKDESGGVRPLTLGKRQKVRKMTSVGAQMVQDENDSIAREEDEVGGSLKGFARSDSNRQRAILRRTEVLPKLVIRPPSTASDAH